MTSQILLEIAILSLLFLLNGVFAMAELAVISSRRERLQILADSGNAGARVAMDLGQEPSNLLSTVQIGITLIGILAGAFGGATLTAELGRLIAPLPVIGVYSELIALIVVVAGITFGSVVMGELVPKQLALRNPERIAATLARPMNTLSRLTRPVVRLLSLTTTGILRLLGVRGEGGAATVSEEEIRMLLEQGAASGVFEAAEHDMLDGIFRFGDRQLRSLMTPRTEIVWLDINADEATIRETVLRSGHSRFPLCEGSIDRVIGVVLARHLLAETWSDRPIDLRALARPPLFLPDTMPAPRALERFKQTGIHAALLVDEFGGIDGLVTIIDMMEAIVGDMPSPSDIAEPPIVRREDGSWLVDGLLDVEDLKTLLGTAQMPNESDYQTLGGFVVTQLGRLPRVGDIVAWGGFRFEVVDMDGNRVDKVLIQVA
ncbi:MAG: HlyC/CorC family transporter [Candidatus Promineofilum sp.]|nr:HlyC/CorC family transporter [Promineifilum sp.]